MSIYTVSMVRGDDVERQGREAVNLLGGMERFVKPGDRVLVKPNMTGPASYEKGVTTNPAVVEALARMALEAGAGAVDIGDGTGSVHIGSLKVLELCGMAEAAGRLGCGLVDLNKGECVKIPVEGGLILDYVLVNQNFLEYDAVINVPVLKTHFITEVSLGMKNMKGCIPPVEKRRFHDVGVNKAVADLNKVVRTALTVMDGTVAGEGLGPKEGRPVGFKTVLAGANVLAVDMTAAAVMGFVPEEIEHIRMAAEHGLGPAGSGEIQVVGEPVEAIRRKFLPAVPTMPDSDRARIINYQACSGCMGAAAIAVSRLTDMGFFEAWGGERLTLVIGTKVPAGVGAEPDTFLLGNCAVRRESGGRVIQGCAPSALDVANMILDYYGITARPYV